MGKVSVRGEEQEAFISIKSNARYSISVERIILSSKEQLKQELVHMMRHCFSSLFLFLFSSFVGFGSLVSNPECVHVYELEVLLRTPVT